MERTNLQLFGPGKCRSAPVTPRHGGSSALNSPRPLSSARSSTSTGLFRGQPPWHFIIRRIGNSYVRTPWVKPEPPPPPASPRHFAATPRNADRSPIHGCTQRSVPAPRSLPLLNHIIPPLSPDILALLEYSLLKYTRSRMLPLPGMRQILQPCVRGSEHPEGPAEHDRG